MSLSPFDSFQSRFVTYLLNRPGKTAIHDIISDHSYLLDMATWSLEFCEPLVEAF